MTAVILAGGKGTRLGDATRNLPKPMMMIGDKPLLHHQVNLLVRYGFSEVIMLVNYLKEPIMDYFADGSRFGIHIDYFEEDTPLGTTGGIKEIESRLKDDFLVLYGDVMVDMDLSRLIRFHRIKNSKCTLVLHPNDHPYDSDLVEVDDDDRILAFHSKPHDNDGWLSNLVNAGVYFFSPEILGFIEKGKKADFGRNVFPKILDILPVYGYHTSEYLKDMGTPDRLELVKHDLETGRIRRSNYEYPQPAIFLDRDGVLNTERSYISKPDELELFDFAPSAIRKINQAGYLSVVVTNQSVIARNLCTEEDVRTIHKKMETILGLQKAWLDAIYYCPHHPDKGFPEENPKYKIDCDCRKPKTGMFRKAIEKFNIEPGISYMIGDSERDIQAGVNAGCTTIGVHTGYGIKKTKVTPDFMFVNLSEAVDFIVDDPLKIHYLKIYDLFSGFSGRPPWIVLIGGNTRSGKSTLASYLRIRFEKKGHRVLHVKLDNWLLTNDKRTPQMNVYERFQLKTIETDIQDLLQGKKLQITTYPNHKERSAQPVEYDPQDKEIIIIEGVVALSSEIIRNLACLKIFTGIESGLFRKRIEEYYTWRGKTKEETNRLVKKRQIDEYQLIEKESKLADLIINTTGS